MSLEVCGDMQSANNAFGALLDDAAGLGKSASWALPTGLGSPLAGGAAWGLG